MRQKDIRPSHPDLTYEESEDIPVKPSTTATFGEIVQRRFGRRGRARMKRRDWKFPKDQLDLTGANILFDHARQRLSKMTFAERTEIVAEFLQHDRCIRIAAKRETFWCEPDRQFFISWQELGRFRADCACTKKHITQQRNDTASNPRSCRSPDPQVMHSGSLS